MSEYAEEVQNRIDHDEQMKQQEPPPCPLEIIKQQAEQITKKDNEIERLIGERRDPRDIAENQRLKELLKVAKCPECDGSGVKRVGEPQHYEGGGHNETVDYAQCQWCNERSSYVR